MCKFMLSLDFVHFEIFANNYDEIYLFKKYSIVGVNLKYIYEGESK